MAKELYADQLLALSRKAPENRVLPTSDGQAIKLSVFCGSHVRAMVKMDGAKIADLAFEHETCALSRAAMAILNGAAIGSTRDDISRGREALINILKANHTTVPLKFSNLHILSAAHQYPQRHTSILLAWDAVLSAIDEANRKQQAIA